MPTAYSFTEYIDFGFKTNIPKLLKREKIYFYFLVAINPIKPGLEDSKYSDIVISNKDETLLCLKLNVPRNFLAKISSPSYRTISIRQRIYSLAS